MQVNQVIGAIIRIVEFHPLKIQLDGRAGDLRIFCIDIVVFERNIDGVIKLPGRDMGGERSNIRIKLFPQICHILRKYDIPILWVSG